MLVLSRRKDESIIIGDNIEITIVDIRGNKVRLGINAPRSVSVHRKEIYDAIQREKAKKAENGEIEKYSAEDFEAKVLKKMYGVEKVEKNDCSCGCENKPNEPRSDC